MGGGTFVAGYRRVLTEHDSLEAQGMVGAFSCCTRCTYPVPAPSPQSSCEGGTSDAQGRKPEYSGVQDRMVACAF